MIPLKDNVPTKTFPTVTILFIVLNCLIYLYQFSLGAQNKEFVYTLGAVPSWLIHHYFAHPRLPQYRTFPYPITVITSMFLHGGLLHLGGNMLYLWIFGNNVEDSMGHMKFIFFYLLCGVIATFAHVWSNPNSRIPIVGASGAISGILGAYLLLYPKARILTLIPLGYFIRIIEIPAVVLLGFWIIIQVFYGLGTPSATAGIAWFAHIGGFIAGLLLINLFREKAPVRRANV